MALTASSMLPLGSKAPDFTLFDVISGKQLSLQALKSPIATVVMFICNHCPFVVHIQRALVEVANTYEAKGIRFIAINSNDIKDYPEDSPEKMKKTAAELQYPFPYLYDESQAVAKAYHAECTPDFFVYQEDVLVYRGRFDDSRPGKDTPVTGKDLSQALDAVLAGKPVPANQQPSMGCNIKWSKN
jgi:peroxiredoxin